MEQQKVCQGGASHCFGIPAQVCGMTAAWLDCVVWFGWRPEASWHDSCLEHDRDVCDTIEKCSIFGAPLWRVD